MRAPLLLVVFTIVFLDTAAQNIGINNTTSRFPLSFENINGNKISLLDDGNPAQLHFGLGVNNNQLLQIYSATIFDDIALGYGNSNNFTERMRIKGNGNIGIGTSTPKAYGHGGTNRLIEILNPGTDPNSQSHLLLSTGSLNGSIGSITWASQGVGIAEQRVGMIGLHFDGITNQSYPPTTMTFYTNNGSGIVERMRITPLGRIGIGSTDPRATIGMPATVGQKISLYDDGNPSGHNYGIGVQSGVLQIHSYTSNDHIAFGWGSSTSFNERVRIMNSGADAMQVNGRMYMRNGTFPNEPAQGPGIWFYKPDNLGQLLGFVGVQNNQNMGFFGGPAGWGFTYDAINSRVGIGNQNPNAPLSFPASLGKKITLYPGATGDVGIGVSGNRLYLYADNPNADVAFGWDAAGVFNERFAVKPTGALAVNGVIGQAGQFLSSNGNSAAATWETFLMTDYISTSETNSGTVNLTGTAPIDLPGSAMTINLARPAKVILYMRASLRKDCAVGSCFTKARMIVSLNGATEAGFDVNGANYGAEFPNSFTTHSSKPEIFNLAAGTYSFTFAAVNVFNDPIFSGGATAIIIYNN